MWLSPLAADGANRWLAAFIDAKPDTHELDDMDEEAVLTMSCEDGLFVLDCGEGKAVWDRLDDGTLVAHADLIALRGMQNT